MVGTPVRLQKADPNKIKCRDCIYRDTTEVVLSGEKVRVGLTRDTCLIYDGKKGNWKPSGVYYMNENCPFYEVDETAPHFWEKGGGEG